MAKHTASQIALWFLSHNRILEIDEGAESISNMKLQKLLYYAQGCSLAVTGEPMFDDNILAWQHGPVVEDVHHTYKHFEANGITFNDDFDSSMFTPEEDELLAEVYETFGQYSAWKLRNMTHEETPWKCTKQNDVIPIGVIKEYFIQEHLA